MRLLILLALLLPLNVFAAQVTFAWDQADKTGVAGYRLGCGAATGSYGTPNDVPGPNTLTKTLTLNPGNYFCAVWAYGSPATLESVKSNELQVAVPLGAPTNLRFTITLTWDVEKGIYVAKASTVREIP